MEAIVLALTSPPAATTANQTDPAMNGSGSPFAPLLSQAISEKENQTDKETPSAVTPEIAESLALALSALGSMQSSPVGNETNQTDFFVGTALGANTNFSALEFLLNSGLIKDTGPTGLKSMLAAAPEQTGITPLFAQAMIGLQTDTATDTPASLVATTASVSPDLMQEQVSGPQPTSVQAGVFSQKQDLTLLLSQLQELIAANETKGIVVQQRPQTAIALNELTNLTSQVTQDMPAVRVGQDLSAAQIAPSIATAQVAQGVPTAQTAPSIPTAQVTQGVPAAQIAPSIPTAQEDQNPPTVHLAQTIRTVEATQAIQPSSASNDTTSAAEISTATNPIPILADNSIEPAPAKPPFLRQEIAQQYLDGKMNLQEDQTKKDGNGQPGQQDNAASGHTPQSLSGFSSIQGDSTGESTLFSIPSQETGTGQPVAHQGKVLTLPSGTMVAEQEIFNQIVQRFHLTTHLQNSRINLKLHPAELGELKIDLTIKEGSIRANVHAQSQHVQEILERNMPKLRTILEQQGFVVEEIVVSSKSETIGDFNLFGEQFSSRQTFTPSENRHPAASSFEAVLDTSITGSVFPESGLNVRA